jgi:hypothetical protein
MNLLSQDAVLVCDHASGIVGIVPTQEWVRVEGRLLLVDNNPEDRPIVGCPNYGATIKPCIKTLRVDQGYSRFLRIDDRSLCLDSVKGLTDGTPPMTVQYTVRSPGQHLLGADA